MQLEIRADYDLNALDQFIDDSMTDWYEDMLETYRTAGKNFADRARAKVKPDSFGNITWNLRSSIGYLLVKDGQPIESYFPTLKGVVEGTKTGDEYAREIASLFDAGEGISLICVAGMEYAVFVEGKGIDVITGSSNTFITEIRSMLGLTTT